MYWQPSAKGDEILSQPLLAQIRKSVEIQSWDLDKGEIENTTVFWSLGPRMKTFDFASVPKEKLVLFLWEPPTVEPEGYDLVQHFGKVYTWDDDLVDNVKFFKFYYPELQSRGEVVPFKKKKFCCMVARKQKSKHPKELYSERLRVIRYFEGKKGFDLYGKGWKKGKGAIPDKKAVIREYKFTFSYENMKDVKGYVTEKMFDCFAAGTVPIYWGASNITDYVPERCFVDRRKFKNEKELVRFLAKMSPETYQGYLDCAEEFLKSDQAQLFSVENFVKIFQTIQNPSS